MHLITNKFFSLDFSGERVCFVFPFRVRLSREVHCELKANVRLRLCLKKFLVSTVSHLTSHAEGTEKQCSYRQRTTSYQVGFKFFLTSIKKQQFQKQQCFYQNAIFNIHELWAHNGPHVTSLQRKGKTKQTLTTEKSREKIYSLSDAFIRYQIHSP